MHDLKNKADIQVLVDVFYTKVRIDPLIGPVFATMIKENQWPVHLERMYGFWNTVLFAQKDYRGNPFSKHATLPLEAKHFERWLTLFTESLDSHFQGKKAEEAKNRALKMATLFQSKLAYIQANSSYKNLL